MYRSVFTVGIALLPDSDDVVLTNALADYSYFNASDGNSTVRIARCVTGLGPSGNNNGELGGLYFNGSAVVDENCSSAIIQPRPANLGNIPGVINIVQCGGFSTTFEGIYACTLRNSAMMNESVRFGVYFTERSESFDLYIPSLNHLSSLYTATPVIDTPSSSTITLFVNSPLTLSCTSQGSPPDTFTWRKDSDPTVLQSTSITAVDYTSTSAVFRADYSIDSVTISDSGTYTCIVANPIGSHSATITVDVEGIYIL